jgi:hypothetical protein
MPCRASRSPVCSHYDITVVSTDTAPRRSRCPYRERMAGGRQIRCRKRGIGVSEQGLIDLPIPESRRLLVKLVFRVVDTTAHV